MNKITKLEIINLDIMTSSEDDFNRKFENLLKFKGLRVTSFTRKDKITIKNSDFPYNMEKKFGYRLPQYRRGLKLENKKLLWDYFDIDYPNIENWEK